MRKFFPFVIDQRVFFILFLFAAGIAADRLIVPQPPFSADVSAYAVIGHELLEGESLYIDVWDHKPPAIFATFAAFEYIFGYSEQTVVILNILVNIVALIGFYYAGKAGGAGFWAALLWTVLANTFKMDAREPNTEVFIIACTVWAFVLLVQDKVGVKSSLIIGLLFALGSFYKPVVVAYGLLMLVHIVLSETRKQALKNALTVSGVGAVSWLAMFAYFALTNRFEIFYASIVSYNSYYSGSIFSNITGGNLLFGFLYPLAAFALIGLIATYTNRSRFLLLLAYITSTWIAIMLPGHFFGHYYQLWLPPLIIGASWGLGRFSDSYRFASYAAGFLLVAGLVAVQVPAYQLALSKNCLK